MSGILIVEDETVVAEDLAQTLARLGYETHPPVDTAASALTSANARRPDLVLMDIRLRGATDGIEAAAQLRALSVPVIFLTAHSDPDTLARARASGAYGYLVKPYHERELHTSIEVALGKSASDRVLAERERWFATTLGALGDAVIATDPELRLTFLNPAAERVLGESAATLIGRPIGEVLTLVDDHGRPLESPIATAVRERMAVRIPPQTRLVRPTGERLIDDAATPIIDAGGTVLGGVVVFRDITEAVAIARRATIAERMASLGTMAAGLVHELNNPLAAVVANVQFARAELARNPEVVDEALADAVEAADRLASIVARVRAFSHVRRGAPQRFELEELVEAAIANVDHAIRHKARLVRAYGPTPTVEVDGGELVQVITNLLANAADAIEDGAVEQHEIRVTLGTAPSGAARVEVRDTGIGIPAAHLERVFDPFFSTKDGEGMGLGLAIARNLAVAAGGSLVAHSPASGGTAFTLELPAALTPVPSPSPGGPVRATVPDVGRARVLVIDDEAAIGRVIARVLRDHDVALELDGTKAVARLRAGETFDVILCDLMMPTMSGIEVVETIRTFAPATADAIVLLTGGAFSPRTTEYLAATRNRVVRKPFNAEDILGAVAAALAAKK